MHPILYWLQRITALILLPLIVTHIGYVYFATVNDFSAQVVLKKFNSHPAWAAYFVVFVLAAAIHGAIGVRNVLVGLFPQHRRATNLFVVTIGVILLALGLRACALLVG